MNFLYFSGNRYAEILIVLHSYYPCQCRVGRIRVITKLPNTQQSSKRKGKTHKSTNRKISQQPENWENAMAQTWYRHFQRNGGLNQISRRQTSLFHYGLKVKQFISSIFMIVVKMLLRVTFRNRSTHALDLCLSSSLSFVQLIFLCHTTTPLMQFYQLIPILSNRIDPGSKHYS